MTYHAELSPGEMLDRLIIAARRAEVHVQVERLLRSNCDIWALEDVDPTEQTLRRIRELNKRRAEAKAAIDEALGYAPEKKSDGWMNSR